MDNQETKDVVETNTTTNEDVTFDDILTVKEFQAEFDRRLGKALNTQKEKFENERAELISNQTKLEEQVKDLESKFNDETSKLGGLEKENLILKSGITDKDEIEFTLFKLSKLEGNFEDNLKSYVESRPKREIHSTGMSMDKTNTVEDENKAYMDKKYANNPYYKK